MPSRNDSVWPPLARWYRRNGRNLPWRNIDDPYRVVVSEFMLQQTQVARVVPKFLAFIEKFPTWAALSRASQASVVRAWSGLGYNMRAVRLRHLAIEVVGRFGGKLPDDAEALLSLKGIGPYTARAIRVFAFRKLALAPDTNIRRVLTRLFLGPKADPKAFDERRWKRWEATLPPRMAYDVNQGLMDIGSIVCKAGVPDCPSCPLKDFCASYPRILALKRHALPKTKAVRKERVDAEGLPDRIYRGRIIERLRRSSAAPSQLASIARADIIAKLVRDGLIEKAGGRYRLR